MKIVDIPSISAILIPQASNPLELVVPTDVHTLRHPVHSAKTTAPDKWALPERSTPTSFQQLPPGKSPSLAGEALSCLKMFEIPSGYVNSLLLKMPIEIVDLPINSMVIFHSYVKLPEGTLKYWGSCS